MRLKFVSELIQIASLRFVEALEGSKITVFIKNFLTKTNKFIFFLIFGLLLKFYAQFYLVLNFSNSCNGKNACWN